ncbi:putative metal-dependent hydrolase [Tamlana sp. PT2-4]|uniref:Metal-dependent hydrolase n=1 Tax=Neotamlana laminarinivorans TaxID=2883124 RepID=A0A9X1I3I4_9FLAO|nr:putative metal-dependent hydrolase [Tamlana laminarinivorans]MCB4799732.1 putative metal-dependent hydrolase [Tamlana laminarinivorans]
MIVEDLQKLKYPIGQFNGPEKITKVEIDSWILELETLPNKLELLVGVLTDNQLDTVYRPGGWTVRQVVHHISDSHHNSYLRFKWALTEDKPLIKAYYEDRWAELFDSKTAPIQMSLNHLKAIHVKLVYLLKGLSLADLQKSFIHPEDNLEYTLAFNVGKYAWHGNHHYAHIENLLKRENWI